MRACRSAHGRRRHREHATAAASVLAHEREHIGIALGVLHVSARDQQHVEGRRRIECGVRRHREPHGRGDRLAIVRHGGHAEAGVAEYLVGSREIDDLHAIEQHDADLHLGFRMRRVRGERRRARGGEQQAGKKAFDRGHAGIPGGVATP